jgi:glucokinase
MKPALIGIEIGGTKTQVVLGDREGLIHRRWRAPVDPERGAEGIRENIRAALDELAAEASPEAVGVGFGGPVYRDTGRIALSYHISGWHDFAIREWLADLTGLPVAVDNDCNVAALGEAIKGAGAGAASMFYVTLGSGMGAGMVIGGKLYHGRMPGESEIGLMPFSPEGESVESHCCGWAVDRKVRGYAEAHPDSKLAGLLPGESGGEARFLRPALDGGCPGAHAILDELAGDLAFALSIAAHLFSPHLIVIGGGLSLVGEPLREAVAARLPGYMTEALKPGPPVALSTLKDDAVGTGALLLAARALG